MKQLLRATAKVIGLLTVLLRAQPCFSQEYPYWFLFEEDLGCGKSAVGIATPSAYRDSAAALSFRQACDAFVRLSEVRLSGGQGFWATEGGTYWMGADFSEEYDTSRAQEIIGSLVALDTVATEGGVFVLVGRAGCSLAGMKGKTLSLVDRPAPSWVQRLPSEKGYHVAVGMAPQYFYETSSWADAERAARRNLARVAYVSYKSMQKVTTTEGQEVRQEELSVTLRDCQVVARWRDLKSGVFYVLMKMPV